ncbi:lysophospholipid acyltransferase family protein, partial [Salmonella sp. SAL4359]|uniref:lysophospholipid acyltransferase family protein n=1 Tax=Salmonella sp. SAL4359 TaxID=3159880 RepID=UPI00397BE27C
VDRYGREIAAAREAVRHLQSGGVVGIFPEGNLERPPCHILPFLPGVGLIVHRSGAPVIPVLISGTPQIDPAWSSLWRRSRAVVQF